MPPVKTRGSVQVHEPYPLNQFSQQVIETICKKIVYLKAVGNTDITGDQFSLIFAESIGGILHDSPLGLVDVSWNGCGWSVKTVKHNKPFDCKHVRLISGRNSPVYSSGINDPFHDVPATGRSVLEIYNARIGAAHWKNKDMRMVVLVRNMKTREFLLYERSIKPYPPNNYEWHFNQNKNLEGYEGERHAFTWQPHGSQFTIKDPVPAGATRFRITHEPAKLSMQDVLRATHFQSDWVQIL